MEKARTWAQKNRLEKKTGRDGCQAGDEGGGGWEETAEVVVWEKKDAGGGRREVELRAWKKEKGSETRECTLTFPTKDSP